MYCIFSFKSRQEAMRFYDTAKKNLIPVMLISTPKFVQLGCGLSVKASVEYYKNLYSLYASMKFSSFLGAYKLRQVEKETQSERIL